MPDVGRGVSTAIPNSFRVLPWNPTDNIDEHADQSWERGLGGPRADCGVWFYCWEMPGFIGRSVLPSLAMLE